MFNNETKTWKYVNFDWPYKCVPALLKYIQELQKLVLIFLIEVNGSYGCTDSFFPSSKKTWLELETELEFYEILADFSE